MGCQCRCRCCSSGMIVRVSLVDQPPDRGHCCRGTVQPPGQDGKCVFACAFSTVHDSAEITGTAHAHGVKATPTKLLYRAFIAMLPPQTNVAAWAFLFDLHHLHTYQALVLKSAISQPWRPRIFTSSTAGHKAKAHAPCMNPSQPATGVQRSSSTVSSQGLSSLL